MRDEIETRVTIKLDRSGRLCVWMGNVQKNIVTDRNKQLVVRGRDCLKRIDGAELFYVMENLPPRYRELLRQNFAIVLPKEKVIYEQRTFSLDRYYRNKKV